MSNQELASEPVDRTKGNKSRLEEGLALCLSGGGYRAMIFHLGALIRLNESGLLAKLDRISSVSGGSISAATLGMTWSELTFTPDQEGRAVATNLETKVIEPVRKLGSKTIDQGAILSGLFSSDSISEKVAKAYDDVIFKGATLQNLPDRPRFVINASNVQTGALWRFMKPYMADYLVGQVERPDVPLALAVAASSAFPPVLSPCKLDIASDANWISKGTLHKAPYITDVVLTDGGVYDNLGLETAWKRYKTIFVSDGGGKMSPEPEPKLDWARHALRINSLIDNQVRCLRKRQVISSFEGDQRSGAYWGIRSHTADYGLPDALPCPSEQTDALANLQTRLRRIEEAMQNRLINWGYAICDTALRRWYPIPNPPPAQFPYAGGV